MNDKTVFILLIKLLFKNLYLQRFSEKKLPNSYEKADSSSSFSFKDNLSQHIAFTMLLNHISFAYICKLSFSEVGFDFSSSGSLQVVLIRRRKSLQSYICFTTNRI